MKLKNKIVAVLTAVLLSVGIFAVPAQANEQTVVTSTQCEGTPATYEYEYTRTIPGQEEVSHMEYRWHRNWEGPKEVLGWAFNGTNAMNVPDPGVWHAVPSSLNPPNNLEVGATGILPRGTYGLPVGNVPYRYQGGEEWWPSSTTYAPSLEGAGDGAWGNPVASIKVVTQEATDPVTEYAWGAEGTFSREWTATGNSRELTAAVPPQWQDGDPDGPCYTGPERPNPRADVEFRDSTVCVEPLDGTAVTTFESRGWTQEAFWNVETKTWEWADVVYGEWEVVDILASPEEECVPPEVPEEPEVSRLAETGGQGPLFIILGGAMLTIALGLTIRAMLRSRKQ